MKFELKTENENYLKSFSNIFKTTFIFALIIILFDVGLKLGIISRYYQIENICNILSVDKSTSNFKKLSNSEALNVPDKGSWLNSLLANLNSLSWYRLNSTKTSLRGVLSKISRPCCHASIRVGLIFSTEIPCSLT